MYLATYVSCSCSVLLLRIEARRGICPLPTRSFGLLIRGFLQKDLYPMARGATPSPAAASVPVAVADSQCHRPAQLGAFKPERALPHPRPSQTCALSPNDIEGRLARRMLCQWPATTIIPSLHPIHSSCEPDSLPDHFLGDLRGFPLASCSLAASSTPHLLSLAPHSGAAPLLLERHCLLFRPA